MSNLVIVLRGVPGCGKSTWIKKNHPEAIVVSADQYFAQPDGSYRHDADKLGEAHADCFRRFLNVVGDTGFVGATLIVDNTSIEASECSPYVLGAQAFGWEVKVVNFVPRRGSLFDWQWNNWFTKCWNRNAHGVPSHTHERMSRRFREVILPMYWTIELVEGDVL